MYVVYRADLRSQVYAVREGQLLLYLGQDSSCVHSHEYDGAHLLSHIFQRVPTMVHHIIYYQPAVLMSFSIDNC